MVLKAEAAVGERRGADLFKHVFYYCVFFCDCFLFLKIVRECVGCWLELHHVSKMYFLV